MHLFCFFGSCVSEVQLQWDGLRNLYLEGCGVVERLLLLRLGSTGAVTIFNKICLCTECVSEHHKHEHAALGHFFESPENLVITE